MTWVAVAVGGAALVGGAVASDSSRHAANTQSDAAAAANATQSDQYNSTVQRNQPFIQGGTTAFNSLVNRLGMTSQIPTAQDVQNEPGYQFGLQQGQNQLDRQLNARGMTYSGAALKAASRYNQDYAGTKYDQAFNRIQGANQQQFNQGIALAGLGQASANNTAAAGQQFAAQTGNNLMGSANAQAANSLAQGNIVNNALNQGVSAYRNYSAPSTGYQTQPTQTFTDGGDYYGHAAGGPIRGPGGPTDDMIPARLSNGEYVLDADTVNALGGGSNERGQNMLNVMRRKLKAK